VLTRHNLQSSMLHWSVRISPLRASIFAWVPCNKSSRCCQCWTSARSLGCPVAAVALASMAKPALGPRVRYEWLRIDLEDPQVLSSWLSLVPAEYLTVTAFLDPVGGIHLIGRDGDVKHGVKAIVDFEALWDIVGGGMGGVVDLLFQYLNAFLKGLGKGFMVSGAVVEGVFQCLDLSL
jgi:hypothetical protein